MNWYSPCADEVVAPAAGSKSDSILAVVSMYWKLTPVRLETCLIAPATRARDASRPDVCEALELSTDMMKCPPRAALSGAGNSAPCRLTVGQVWLMRS